MNPFATHIPVLLACLRRTTGPILRVAGWRSRLHGKCRLLIAHDSQHDAYGYGPAFERFKYRVTFDRLVPWTTVVSDTDPLAWLDEALRPLW